MENHSPSISGMTLRDAPGDCHGVLPELDETVSTSVWQVQSSRMVRFFEASADRLLEFKQPPNLFPGQRFSFEQCLLDFFHTGTSLF
jgi:hypothetical protein